MRVLGEMVGVGAEFRALVVLVLVGVVATSGKTLLPPAFCDPSPCHAHAICISERCECLPGWAGDGFICNDVDECVSELCDNRDGLCDANNCPICAPGFRGNPTQGCQSVQVVHLEANQSCPTNYARSPGHDFKSDLIACIGFGPMPGLSTILLVGVNVTCPAGMVAHPTHPEACTGVLQDTPAVCLLAQGLACPLALPAADGGLCCGDLNVTQLDACSVFNPCTSTEVCGVPDVSGSACSRTPGVPQLDLRLHPLAWFDFVNGNPEQAAAILPLTLFVDPMSNLNGVFSSPPQLSALKGALMKGATFTVPLDLSVGFGDALVLAFEVRGDGQVFSAFVEGTEFVFNIIRGNQLLVQVDDVVFLVHRFRLEKEAVVLFFVDAASRVHVASWDSATDTAVESVSVLAIPARDASFSADALRLARLVVEEAPVDLKPAVNTDLAERFSDLPTTTFDSLGGNSITALSAIAVFSAQHPGPELGGHLLTLCARFGVFCGRVAPCFCGSEVDATNRFWDHTVCGAVASAPCPSGRAGRATRDCLATGAFGLISELGCQLEGLAALDADAVEEAQVESVTADVFAATTTLAADFEVGDALKATKLMDALARAPRVAPVSGTVRNQWVDSVSGLLDADDDVLVAASTATAEGGFLAAEYRVEAWPGAVAFDTASFLAAVADAAGGGVDAAAVRAVEVAVGTAATTLLAEVAVADAATADAALAALTAAGLDGSLLAGFAGRVSGLAGVDAAALRLAVVSAPVFFATPVQVVLEGLLASLAGDLAVGEKFEKAAANVVGLATRVACADAETRFDLGAGSVAVPAGAVPACASNAAVTAAAIREKAIFTSDAAAIAVPGGGTAAAAVAAGAQQAGGAGVRFTLLNSDVLGVDFPGRDTSALAEPVRLTLTAGEPLDEGSTTVCAFWDDVRRTWRTDGCTATATDAALGTVSCECDHLTYFAILTTYDSGALPSGEQRFAQELLTWVGLGVSIPCLLLTFAVYLVARRARTHAKFIVMHLSLSLAAAQAVFLFGIARTDDDRQCEAIGMGLHYFLLCAFSWMLLDGIYLYRTFCMIFESMGQTSYAPYLAVGYGLPAIPVAITAAVNRARYRREDACWLDTEGGFIWAFVGPAAAVLLVNAVFFALVLHKIQQLPVVEHGAFARARARSRRSFKASLSFMPLMGLGWVFGLFILDDAALVFQYVFTASNVLQGVVIFYFHVVLEESLRKLWRGEVRRRQRSKDRIHDAASVMHPMGTRIMLRPGLHSKPSGGSDPDGLAPSRPHPSSSGGPLSSRGRPSARSDDSHSRGGGGGGGAGTAYDGGPVVAGVGDHFYPPDEWSEDSFSGIGSLLKSRPPLRRDSERSLAHGGSNITNLTSVTTLSAADLEASTASSHSARHHIPDYRRG